MSRRGMNMRSTCSVKLSGRPSPVFAGGAAARLSVPPELFALPDAELIQKVYGYYQGDQLNKFSHTEYSEFAQGNYLKFIEAVELAEKTKDTPTHWAIGKGFTVYTKSGERLECNRFGKLIGK
jgi:hypothetical protein